MESLRPSCIPAVQTTTHAALNARILRMARAHAGQLALRTTQPLVCTSCDMQIPTHAALDARIMEAARTHAGQLEAFLKAKDAWMATQLAMNSS